MSNIASLWGENTYQNLKIIPSFGIIKKTLQIHINNIKNIPMQVL